MKCSYFPSNFQAEIAISLKVLVYEITQVVRVGILVSFYRNLKPHNLTAHHSPSAHACIRFHPAALLFVCKNQGFSQVYASSYHQTHRTQYPGSFLKDRKHCLQVFLIYSTSQAVAGKSDTVTSRSGRPDTRAKWPLEAWETEGAN